MIWCNSYWKYMGNDRDWEKFKSFKRIPLHTFQHHPHTQNTYVWTMNLFYFFAGCTTHVRIAFCLSRSEIVVVQHRQPWAPRACARLKRWKSAPCQHQQYLLFIDTPKRQHNTCIDCECCIVFGAVVWQRRASGKLCMSIGTGGRCLYSASTNHLQCIPTYISIIFAVRCATVHGMCMHIRRERMNKIPEM